MYMHARYLLFNMNDRQLLNANWNNSESYMKHANGNSCTVFQTNTMFLGSSNFTGYDSIMLNEVLNEAQNFARNVTNNSHKGNYEMIFYIVSLLFHTRISPMYKKV